MSFIQLLFHSEILHLEYCIFVNDRPTTRINHSQILKCLNRNAFWDLLHSQSFFNSEEATLSLTLFFLCDFLALISFPLWCRFLRGFDLAAFVHN